MAAYDAGMVNLAGQLPSSLKAKARWERLGSAKTPAMLVHPDWQGPAAPVVIWMHGRTANKELDAGRYLRWMRAGIAACTVDLPGHGERLDEALLEPTRTLDVVTQMAGEIDDLVEALSENGSFDMNRVGIGGISAGGMATLLRLCRPHPFVCASVEATSGSWQHQKHRDMFRDMPGEDIEKLDPMTHLDNWREMPLQAIHSKLDEWMDIAGQQAFIDALKARYADPELVEFVVYEQTGAPHEHIGFGKRSADAKNRQVDFFSRHLR